MLVPQFRDFVNCVSVFRLCLYEPKLEQNKVRSESKERGLGHTTSLPLPRFLYYTLFIFFRIISSWKTRERSADSVNIPSIRHFDADRQALWDIHAHRKEQSVLKLQLNILQIAFSRWAHPDQLPNIVYDTSPQVFHYGNNNHRYGIQQVCPICFQIALCLQAEG